ncbi:MAG: M48 family metallopeptidase [Deltaproteobacteria bacterium]|nr:M48 family metallopeptidase [Deltaproteobacteria bacterium]MBW2100642.1 M48 family metallopeptidase [Deltaproteobacteria bacterium]
MNGELKSVSYGKRVIDYNLFYVDRKTLEIAVHPDGEIIIKAPVGSTLEAIERKVLKRSRWIIRQLNYFNQFNPRTPERLYIGGETHLYLGRQYRLKINNDIPKCVKLSRGLFQVSSGNNNDPMVVKKLLESWYVERAFFQFNDSIDRCWPAFAALGLTRPRLRIKRMKKRWGSLSKNGIITLNTELVKAPKECIDYVVTHELCHLNHHDHSPEFYNLLERVLPNWEKIKHKLELTLV